MLNPPPHCWVQLLFGVGDISNATSPFPFSPWVVSEIAGVVNAACRFLPFTVLRESAFLFFPALPASAFRRLHF